MPDDLKTRSRIHVWKLGVLGMGLLALACHRSDAVRAQDERLKIQKELASAWSLVPYRSFKLLARASGGQPPVPEVEALWTRLEALRTGSESGNLKSALQAGGLLLEARGLLKARDEDQFPTLGSRVRTAPLPAWYDSGADHAVVGLVLYLARRGGVSAVPQPYLLYEASRAVPSAAWPVDLRVLARFQQASTYQEAKAHYAAEEAYDAYLREVAGMTGPEAWFAKPADAQAFQEGLRGLGHVGRGLNRLDLGRDALADQDFQQGLAALDVALPDSELTQWLGALIHARAGRGAEAAARLQRLARSPGLDEAGRTAVQEAAEGVTHASRPGALLATPRMMFLVLRAWEARTHALSGAWASLGVGGDRSPLHTQVAWVERIQAHLTPPAPEGLLQRLRRWKDTETSVPGTGKGR